MDNSHKSKQLREAEQAKEGSVEKLLRENKKLRTKITLLVKGTV